MSVNDVMDDEVLMEQVIMVHGKPKKIKVILDELLHRKNGTHRAYSEG